jgi:signal transduction histidine kinase
VPFTLRGRLAVAFAAVIIAVLGVYTLMVISFDAAQLSAQHRSDEKADLELLGNNTATRIRVADEAGTVLYTLDPGNRPMPTQSLRAIVESANGFIWVLDRFGFTIYNSGNVRTLSDSLRGILDTLVASIPLGGGAVKDDALGVRIAPLEPGVRNMTLSGEQVLLYAVEVNLHPSGVNRVVVGHSATPAPPSTTSFKVPFLLVLPIVVLVAIGTAGVFNRMSLAPMDERIKDLINNVEAISDGRSLHKRVAFDAEVGEQLERLTETLNAMIGRLEASFAGLRRFTADASHELKTPLTVLRADVERAMSSGTSHAEQLVALEEALAETARMADLVDSLLTLARADEGRFDLVREPVDLEAVTRDVMETAVLLGEATRIDVKMNPPAHVTVPGDRARIRQMFLNLVTNAIKYTPPGGSVELSLAVEDGFAKFGVRDTGIGIAAADLPHVFERFWRADRARSRVGERGGFGLGLAISHYIAHAHGGSLTVRSRLGRGSTFTVSLPVEHPTEQATEK